MLRNFTFKIYFSDKIDNQDEIITLKNSLQNVTAFHFGCGQFLIDIDNFCKIKPLLGHKIIKFCYSGFQCDFKIILDFIEQNKSSLKQINIFRSNIDGHTLQSLSVFEDLHLTSVHLIECFELTDSCLETLLEHQKNIKELDLINCPGITNDTVLAICKNLPKIESLKIRGCRSITDVSLDYF